MFLPIRSGFHFHENTPIGLSQVTLFRENPGTHKGLERFLLCHSIKALFGSLPRSGDVVSVEIGGS